MITCSSCGASYYKVRRDDIGICDGCRNEAAESLRGRAKRPSSSAREGAKEHLPKYRQETAEVFRAFYANKGKKRKKGKRK